MRVWGGMEDRGGATGDTDPPSPASNSLPATTVLPMSWHRVEGSRRLEDHGIKVEHVYQVGCCTHGCPGGLFPLSPPWCHLPILPQLHNKGPSTVSGVTLHLAVPSQLGGRILLYLLELGTEGGMNCTNPPGLNAEQVGCCLGTGAHPLGAGWVLRWCPSPLPLSPSSWRSPGPRVPHPEMAPTSGSAGRWRSRWVPGWRSPSRW